MLLSDRRSVVCRDATDPAVQPSIRKAVALAGLLLPAVAAPAHAYIDPGVASMIVQGVVAAIAAVSSALYLVRARIRRFFGRLLGRPAATDQPAPRSGENER